MLDIQLLRTDLENIAGLLATRGYSFPIPQFETLEAERKRLQTHTQARRWVIAKSIIAKSAAGVFRVRLILRLKIMSASARI